MLAGYAGKGWRGSGTRVGFGSGRAQGLQPTPTPLACPADPSPGHALTPSDPYTHAPSGPRSLRLSPPPLYLPLPPCLHPLPPCPLRLSPPPLPSPLTPAPLTPWPLQAPAKAALGELLGSVAGRMVTLYQCLLTMDFGSLQHVRHTSHMRTSHISLQHVRHTSHMGTLHITTSASHMTFLIITILFQHHSLTHPILPPL